MAKFTCFSTLLVGKKKRSKESKRALDVKKGEASGNIRVKPIDLPNPTEEMIVRKEDLLDSLPPKPETASNQNLVRLDSSADLAYEACDEHDELLSMKRDYSDLELHLQVQENFNGSNQKLSQLAYGVFDNKSETDKDLTPELVIQTGHVSDPGIGRATTLLGSSILKRSCSNIETKRTTTNPIYSPAKSHSYNDLRNLLTDMNSLYKIQSSPFSAKSNCSADNVMLKKRSSSQVLPSRSRKVWWKLFLWSHRNLHNPQGFYKAPLPGMASHHRAGYSSDTIEPFQTPNNGKKKAVEESGNQWVAFSMDSSSPFDRINAWVNSIEESRFCPIDKDGDDDEDEEGKGLFFLSNSPEIGESSGKNHSSHADRRTTEEIVQANNVIQSLNSLSSVAHISGMGLKVIPSISAFSSLRSINLSGNLIVQISPGSLPKSLQTMDLSRNKIATVEGLRELTRLRVLNLSYNRISRVGHGLSNCTLIKELYLAGNKISDVEGLHRLKLAVLDLSFNKITTTKSLGQLVANYNSLLALNLIGNPIQSNIGDDNLRKAVCSLLPHLTYFNKQPIRPQRVREAATDSVAKAALGNGSLGGRRRIARRASQSSGLASLAAVKGRSSKLGGNKKGSKRRLKGRQHHSTTSSRK